MSNIHGLGSSKKEEDGEKRNEFYTGGADGHGGGSGMAVLGPPPGGGRAPPTGVNDVFNRLVQSASQHTQEGDDGEAPPTDEENNVITIYSNGFRVNDGPLRDPENNEENRAFLDELLKGYVPRELRPTRKDPSKPMNISLADKRSETYTPPAYVPFSSGTSLGGGSPNHGGSFDPATLPMGPELVANEATTTIQIKTSSGKKLRLKVNTSITVLQLAAIVAEQAGQGDQPFSLSSGFPPQDLTDHEATIEAAGLKGASITQR